MTTIDDLFAGRPAISTAEVAAFLDVDEATARDFAAEEELDRLGSSFMWEPADVAALEDDLTDEDADDDDDLASNPLDDEEDDADDDDNPDNDDPDLDDDPDDYDSDDNCA